MSDFVKQYLEETNQILFRLTNNSDDIENVALALSKIKHREGRLFILGIGGSAGHASHAVNDFRKICKIESYTPTDNISELTARVNDEGFDTCFSAWLEGCNLNAYDGILILSVGGGNVEKNISMPIVNAIKYAQSIKATILGIVGKDGGATKQMANACVVIPPLFEDKITPHTEGLCSVILHCLASHPLIKENITKWESVK